MQTIYIKPHKCATFNCRGNKNIILLAPGNLPGSSYFTRVFSTIQMVTAQHGYTCNLMIEDDIQRKMQDPAWRGRLDLPADGIIVFSSRMFDYDSYLRVIRQQKIPCVLVRRRTQVPGVIVFRDDDQAGSTLAMEHLFSRGHRIIGYFGRYQNLFNVERKQAYRRFMREHHLPDDPRLIFEQSYLLSTDEWQSKCTAWLSALMLSPGAPTAFFCQSDGDARVLLEQLQRLGKRVPQDVAIIGYDDDEESRNSRPPLTTVRMPLEEMSQEASRLLINKQTETSPPEVVFPNTLVVRESCGAKLAEKKK